MLDRAIYGLAIYAAVLTVLFVATLWENRGKPFCLRCQRPIQRCVCFTDEGDYGHDPHVARTLRIIESGAE